MLGAGVAGTLVIIDATEVAAESRQAITRRADTRNCRRHADPIVLARICGHGEGSAHIGVVSHQWYILENNINGLVQERRNSSALAMELRLSCTNPLIYSTNTRSQI